MARAEPNNVNQITELCKFKELLPAIHAFNSLVLDEKIRWYSEKLGADYFGTRTEFENYMKRINNKPMDFGTIRKNILNNHYKNSCSELFHDMELVFKNAMIFNKEGDLWYIPANRLFTILQALKHKSVIQKETCFKPCNDECRTCPHCNNIMLPIKTITTNGTKRCAAADCSVSLNHPENISYICHNHSHQARNFCQECVQKLCHRCFNWHSGIKCVTKYCWPVLNLQVPPKPRHIESVSRFENIKCNPTLNKRIQIIIEQIKEFDSERHFFKRVENEQYASIVKKPIHFGKILKRVNKNKYRTIGDYEEDNKEPETNPIDIFAISSIDTTNKVHHHKKKKRRKRLTYDVSDSENDANINDNENKYSYNPPLSKKEIEDNAIAWSEFMLIQQKERDNSDEPHKKKRKISRTSSLSKDKIDDETTNNAQDTKEEEIDDAQDDDSKLCIVCLDGNRDHIMIPCGHICICKMCKDLYTNHDAKCPVCRRKVQNVIKTYN